MAEEKKSICKDCGLCCDGTLFQYGVLGKDDNPDNWEKLKVVDKGDKVGMEYPCAYLDGCNCSIYNEDKPSMCTKYSCKLLKRYDADLISFEESKGIINRTKQLKDVFEAEYNEHYIYDKGKSLRENITILSGVVGTPEEFRTYVNDREDLSFALSDLRKIIANHFKKKKS